MVMEVEHTTLRGAKPNQALEMNDMLSPLA